MLVHSKGDDYEVQGKLDKQTELLKVLTASAVALGSIRDGHLPASIDNAVENLGAEIQNITENIGKLSKRLMVFHKNTQETHGGEVPLSLRSLKEKIDGMPSTEMHEKDEVSDGKGE